MINLTKLGSWYNKNYKRLLIIPALLILLCIIFLFIFYSQTGDFIRKDISLTGGTTITLYGNFYITDLESELSSQLPQLNVKKIYDVITNEEKAIILETTSDPETAVPIIELYLGYQLDEKNSSIEFTGSSLSNNFYKQLLLAFVFAFLLMAIIVFILFRNFIPSITVVVCAFADILMTLVVTNLLGIKISSAGLIAFLMLLGYSVDTDIMLTSRVLKSTENYSLNQRIFKSFKTGIVMSATSIIAVLCALILVQSFSSALTQIFQILLIGLFFDVFNTWLTNASVIKWYLSKKK